MYLLRERKKLYEKTYLAFQSALTTIFCCCVKLHCRCRSSSLAYQLVSSQVIFVLKYLSIAFPSSSGCLPQPCCFSHHFLCLCLPLSLFIIPPSPSLESSLISSIWKHSWIFSCEIKPPSKPCPGLIKDLKWVTFPPQHHLQETLKQLSYFKKLWLPFTEWSHTHTKKRKEKGYKENKIILILY